MEVPFVDLKAQYLAIKPEMDAAIQEVLDETAFIGGDLINRFEKEFADLYGVKHCVSVANGTDAIYIALKMLGIGQGDEVITTAHSWISSSETISQTGARVVFVDTSSDYFCLDEAKLEAAITPRTKAIIPVHLYGQVCDMAKILSIAEKYNLKVIEDCAQSHFSEFEGQKAGTMGNAGSFSFYPGKNLGAYGDAGCLITNDDDLAEKCKMYARHGALKKHNHQIEGINSRLDGLQAAVLRTKLPHILDWTQSRINNAAYYTAGLEGVGDIVVPKLRPNSRHTFHLYVIRTNQRDELQAFLNENGVSTAIHYPHALPTLPAYDYLGLDLKQYPVAIEQAKQILSLPMYPELNEEKMDYVIKVIKEFFTTH